MGFIFLVHQVLKTLEATEDKKVEDWLLRHIRHVWRGLVIGSLDFLIKITCIVHITLPAAL